MNDFLLLVNDAGDQVTVAASRTARLRRLLAGGYALVIPEPETPQVGVVDLRDGIDDAEAALAGAALAQRSKKAAG